MRLTFIIMIIAIIPFYNIGVAITSDVHVISLKIKNIGYDSNLNANRLGANISLDSPGHIIYLEEYYTIDGNSNPKFCCAEKYYEGNLMENISIYGKDYNATFDISRPLPHKGKVYSLIKGIIIYNDVRIYEKWLTKNTTFIDNTNSEDQINIDTSVHETRQKTLNINQPSVFVFTNSDPIYEINMTGVGDTSLRVEILKDTPVITYLSKGIAYRYINIISDNYKINQFYIKYRIQNSWIINGSIKSLGLFIWRNDDKIWSSLPSKIIDKDNTFTYFESNLSKYPDSPYKDLSPLAILGFSKSQEGLVNMSIEDIPISDEIYPIESPRSVVVKPMKRSPGIGIVLNICILLAVFFIMKSRLRKSGRR